jgi:pimeloyl-ACP methyl ester carboxylesterase
LKHWEALATLLQNVRYNIYSDATSQPRRPESLIKLLRGPQNFCNFNLFSGHSFGSVVAFVYSALFPDDVDTYVAIDCVRALTVVQKEDLLDRIRYSLDKTLAKEQRLAFDPPSYTYEELREMVHNGSRKSLSLESCDILLQRGMKKLSDRER